MDAREYIYEHNPDAVFLDGFDDAIAGIAESNGVLVALYDESKIIKILMEKEELSYDEAMDHFYFNIEGAYLGENMPIFFTPFPNTVRK